MMASPMMSNDCWARLRFRKFRDQAREDDAAMGKQGPSRPEGDLEKIYLDFLRSFYEAEDLPRSRRIAKQVKIELARRPDLAESIRGDELRSMVAELDGDVASAIKYRENEIRRILELHSLVKDSPGWTYVFSEYDYKDISDRIDILAYLYSQIGDYGQAVELLKESQRFCASHGVVFDAEDMLEEFTEKGRPGSAVSSEPLIDLKILNVAIIEAYRDLKRSSDQILVDEDLSRKFAAEVLRRLPADMQIPMKSLKERLLNLRRRGEDHGGLPRLRRRG